MNKRDLKSLKNEENPKNVDKIKGPTQHMDERCSNQHQKKLKSFLERKYERGKM